MKHPKNEPFNFPRLLGEITREYLAKFSIYPVDTEACYEELLNDCESKVKILGLEYDAGKVLRLIDPVAFRTFENDNTMNQIQDGIWIEVDGEIFDKAEVIEQTGLEVEE